MKQDEINAVKKAAEKMRKQESAQDEIIEMYMQVSKELCNDTEWCWAGVGKPLQMFAKLVAAKAFQSGYEKGIAAFNEAVWIERESCEALHEHEDVQAPVGNSSWGEAYQEGWAQGTAAYRAVIKARGKQA